MTWEELKLAALLATPVLLMSALCGWGCWKQRKNLKLWTAIGGGVLIGGVIVAIGLAPIVALMPLLLVLLALSAVVGCVIRRVYRD